MRMFQTDGRKWAQMGKELGRSSASVRNRFLRIQAGRRAVDEGLSKNRCGICKAFKRGHICTAAISSGLPVAAGSIVEDVVPALTVAVPVVPMTPAPSPRSITTSTPSTFDVTWESLLPSPAVLLATSTPRTLAGPVRHTFPTPLLPIRSASGNFSSAQLRREASHEFHEFQKEKPILAHAAIGDAPAAAPTLAHASIGDAPAAADVLGPPALAC